MLTNIPETAEKATGMGQDVYFLSDRPETEQFLAEKTPQRPYKRVLRDVRATKPTEEDLTGLDAWKEFKEGYLSKQPGYADSDEINPPAQAQKARQTYLEGFFRGKSKPEIDTLDPAYVQKLYKEADRISKAEEVKATWTRRNALEIKNKFLTDWKARQKEIKEAKAAKEKEPLVPVQEGENIVYRRRSEAVGKQAPVRNLVPTIDEEGNITYTPAPQAAGKTPAPKGKTPMEKAEEQAVKEEKEARTYVDKEFKWASDVEKEYELKKRLAEIRKTTPPEPPEEVLEQKELPRGTIINPQKREHIAVIKRIRREAEAEAKGNVDKARKIFNQKLEKKGWIVPKAK